MDVRLFIPQVEREEIEYMRALKECFSLSDYTDLKTGFHGFLDFLRNPI
jgi:hypothetical protein